MAYNENYPTDNELVKNLPKSIRVKGESLKEIIESMVASGVSYDNSESGLSAINIQDAIDELEEYLFSFKALYTGMFYDNAGFHNSIYRGKFLGTSVTSEQYANIQNGTFHDMFIGDYWTINGTDYVIAAFNYYLGVGDTGVSVNHVTIVPRVAFYNHVMNDTHTTEGGYMGSKMYAEGLDQAKTKIKAAFPGRVLKHRKLLSNATVGGKASGWAWVDSEIDLMTEVMVYGSVVWGESTIGGSGYNIGVGKTQLPLFRFRPDMISMRSHAIWLSCVVSATLFASVLNRGDAHYGYAGTANGVLPAFSIS